MRFTNKYKLHVNLNVSTRRLPKSRIEKFHRTKWFKTKNIIIRSEKTYAIRSSKFFNVEKKEKKRMIRRKILEDMKEEKKEKPGKWAKKHVKGKDGKVRSFHVSDTPKHVKPLEETQIFTDFILKEAPTYGIPRIRQRSRYKLQMRKYLLSLFDDSINFEIEKSLKMRREILVHFLIKPYYRLDLLLWSLDCFRTSFESRQKITSKKIFVNGEIGKSNYFVKKGDIISFSVVKGKGKVWNNFIQNSKIYRKNCCFFTFLEMDYYSNNIVILKDWSELSKDDFKLLVEDNVEVAKVYR